MELYSYGAGKKHYEYKNRLLPDGNIALKSMFWIYNGKQGETEIGIYSFYHITEDSLLQYTLDLLEIVREWLIDLAMAIHIEEMKRKDNKEEEKSFQCF